MGRGDPEKADRYSGARPEAPVWPIMNFSHGYVDTPSR